MTFKPLAPWPLAAAVLGAVVLGSAALGITPLGISLASPAVAQTAARAEANARDGKAGRPAASRPQAQRRPAPIVEAPEPAPTAASTPEDIAPALAPPSPADLAPQPRAAQAQPAAPVAPSPTLPPLTLPPDMEALPQGGFRLRFATGTASLPPAAAGTLVELGRRLAAGPEGRVVLTGQASGPVADVSVARRLSLARGLAVKQALVDGGLPPTRIDLRPMGRTADAADAVDVQPPPEATSSPKASLP